MKFKYLLLTLLLVGCSNSTSSFNSSSSSFISSVCSSESTLSTSKEDISLSVISSSSIKESSSLEDSSFNNESSSSSSIKESSSSEEFNACLDKNGDKNIDGSDKLPIPCNKDNKVKIGNDNKSMTSFDFTYSLPDYFRAIYGNNFNKSNNIFYANGGYQIKMGGPSDPSRGIQTAMFESNLKLEIRINIGEMHNNSKGNEVNKDLPVMVIYAFDEDGNYLRKVDVATITKKNENSSIKKYMDGKDVAYLEVRALQCAYKSSQGYNYALMGIDLIAWPYEID